MHWELGTTEAFDIADKDRTLRSSRVPLALDMPQTGQPKSKGFAGASCCDADQVFAAESQGDALSLDWGRSSEGLCGVEHACWQTCSIGRLSSTSGA